MVWLTGPGCVSLVIQGALLALYVYLYSISLLSCMWGRVSTIRVCPDTCRIDPIILPVFGCVCGCAVYIE